MLKSIRCISSRKAKEFWEKYYEGENLNQAEIEFPVSGADAKKMVDIIVFGKTNIGVTKLHKMGENQMFIDNYKDLINEIRNRPGARYYVGRPPKGSNTLIMVGGHSMSLEFDMKNTKNGYIFYIMIPVGEQFRIRKEWTHLSGGGQQLPTIANFINKLCLQK